MSSKASGMDPRYGAMLRALAEVISEELPEAGFVLVMASSETDNTTGSLVSLSNLDDEDTAAVLETVIARRRGGRTAVIPTLQ